LIETERLQVLAGTPQRVDVPRDAGPMQRIFRCPQCQTAVFSEYGSQVLRYVRAGTLDDPRDISPDVHIFARSKVAWVTLPDETPAFDVFYDRKELWPEPSLRRLEAVLPQVTG
jgi:hypothetical protein